VHPSAKATFVFLGIVVGLHSTMQQAYAQEYFRLNVFLDKVAYVPDEIIKVTGCLSSEGTSVLGKLVSVEVQGPDGESVLSDSATVDATCNFDLDIDSRSLPEHGNYLVVATHESASGKKAFRFSDETNVKEEGECVENYCRYYFELLGLIYQVEYKLTSGKLDSIVVDLPARSLMFLINSTESNGNMTALLPRNVLDSSQNGTDIRYKVFVGSVADGVKQIVHDEVAADEATRTIAVDYPKSNEHILVSINGTHIAPEFGNTLMIIVAIAGAVVASSRFRRTKTKVSD
jgi:hypothetical protein